MEKHSRESVLALLHGKHAALCAAGENRYPRRSDFSDAEVCAIKAFLGPWPRALEAAGIKPPRNDDRLARNREKRIRAKRNRRLREKESDPTRSSTIEHNNQKE